MPSRLAVQWVVIACGIAALYIPSLWDLLEGIWTSDQQGHGPIVLGISLWLMWKQWPIAFATRYQPRLALGWTLFALAIAAYAIGRSQQVLLLEVGSVILLLAALTLIFHGSSALKAMAFPLFFMVFMIPLPGSVVDAITLPMKTAVSYVVEAGLHAAGYPIVRTGVILQIGQYQLLVADACAGLHTLFTLEALGLLYLNIVRHESLMRNVLLAILVVPISFTANVLRVAVLTLITYHLGDEAGQGFLHGFAGVFLFMAALLLIIATDTALRHLFNAKHAGTATHA